MSHPQDTQQPSQPHSGSASGFLFLSYNSLDRRTVQDIQHQLRTRDISTFFDRDQLQPGMPWFDALQEAIGKACAVAVFIGKHGLGTWQKREMELALDRQAREEKAGARFPVIPVVLQGVDLEKATGFLLLNTWIDLRSGIDETIAIEAMARVVHGERVFLSPSTSAALCPYRALRAFWEEDASLFFGREAFAAELLQKTLSQQLVAVVGPSGSGKTSVVQAGLLPLLRREHPPSATWDAVIFSPGRRPFHNLAAAFVSIWETASGETQQLREAERLGNDLATGKVALEAAVNLALKKASGSDRLLMVVDQFEELFTLAPEGQRRSFVKSLLELISVTPVTVVITLRADFYGQAIDLSRDLSDRMQRGQVNLGSMTRVELRKAIEKPAEAVDLQFQSGLTERILEQIEDEPGNLPLLEFALTELWEMRQGRFLTNEKYDEIGGVEGAISKRAELQFTKLTTEQQGAALRLLSRLARVAAANEEGTYTRQRIGLSELDESLQAVVQSFVNARLLVTNRNEATGEETVEVAHEALIRAWARLKTFLDQDRKFYLWRQRLDLKKEEWQKAGMDNELLLRGSNLLEAKRLLRLREKDLTELERTFIKNSELAAGRPRRWLLAIVAVVLLLLVTFASAMYWVRTDSYQVKRILTESPMVASSASAPAVRRWIKALTYAGKLEEALRLTGNIKDPEQRIYALSDIAHALNKTQKTEDARKFIREAQSKAIEIEHLGRQYQAFEAISKELIKTRNIDECIFSIQQMTSPVTRAQALVALGEAVANEQRADDAALILETALQAARSINALDVRADGFGKIATVLVSLGKTNRAKQAIEEALVAVSQIKDPGTQSTAYGQLTKLLFKIGDHDEGKRVALLTYVASRRITNYRGIFLSEICDALVKAGKEDEVFDETLASWNANQDLLQNPLGTLVAWVTAMDENGMRDKALAKIGTIAEPAIQYQCYGVIIFNLADEGKTDRAIEVTQQIPDPQLQSFVMRQLIAVLLGNGKREEAFTLAHRFNLSSDPLVLLIASGILAESRHADEALAMARKIEVPNVKGLALSGIVQEAVKYEGPEKVRAMVDEALGVAQNISNDDLRSAIFTMLASAQANLKDFRNARLTAGNCASSDEILLVYRSILLEYISGQNTDMKTILDEEEKARKENDEIKVSVSMSPGGLNYKVERFSSERPSDNENQSQ